MEKCRIMVEALMQRVAFGKVFFLQKVAFTKVFLYIRNLDETV